MGTTVNIQESSLNRTVVYVTDVYLFKLLTIEHDGHKFVVGRATSDEPVSIIHHPSCECQK